MLYATRNGSPETPNGGIGDDAAVFIGTEMIRQPRLEPNKNIAFKM